MTSVYGNQVRSYRMTESGRVSPKYTSDPELLALWKRAIELGVPAEHVLPGGASDPREPIPADSWLSEFILRAYEALFDDCTSPNSPYPRIGFRPNLRIAVSALEDASKTLTELWGVNPADLLEPAVSWIAFRALGDAAALFPDGSDAPRSRAEKKLKAIDRDIRSGRKYPYFSPAWKAYRAEGEALIEADFEAMHQAWGIPHEGEHASHAHAIAGPAVYCRPDKAPAKFYGYVPGREPGEETEVAEDIPAPVAELPARDPSDVPVGMGEGMKTWVGYLSARSIPAIEWEQKWATADDEEKAANDKERFEREKGNADGPR